MKYIGHRYPLTLGSILIGAESLACKSGISAESTVMDITVNTYVTHDIDHCRALRPCCTRLMNPNHFHCVRERKIEIESQNNERQRQAGRQICVTICMRTFPIQWLERTSKS